ncbi:MAG: ABC transporter permease [Spirochaetaceae bacterium]|nr:ABC transporter permease [Spirochaetaceae bacterium]
MAHAFGLLFSGDPETWGIIGRSLIFSGLATFFSLIPGIPLGIFMAWKGSKPRRALATFIHAISALPTVVIGLFIYSLISRSGPLGGAGFLYAPAGVVIGQFFLATPLVASVTYAGVSRLDTRFKETLVTLGASPWLEFCATMREAKTTMLTSAVLSFGRVIGEVGVSTMLGGNIRGFTRTMTTAIALDAAKGEFEQALSLGLVLLIISVVINTAANRLADHA